MKENLKEQVLKAYKDLAMSKLDNFCGGNVSAIDRESEHIVIKASGVSIKEVKAENLLVVDFSGKVLEGEGEPPSEFLTHISLYNAHKDISSIVHVHSMYATAFAQAGRFIPAYGVTHTEFFGDNIPCVRALTKGELSDFDASTGILINKTFKKLSFKEIRACLLERHGMFSWGDTPDEALKVAFAAERLAELAYLTENLNPKTECIPQYMYGKKQIFKKRKKFWK